MTNIRKGSRRKSKKGSRRKSKKGSINIRKDRPSPSDSATLFKVGTTKKGNDGNNWIITKNKNGIKKWSKESESVKLSSIVFDHLYPWWSKVSSGSIIIIYKNGKYETYTSKMKTRNAQIKDIEKVWKAFAEDNKVEAIVTSAMSTDALTDFADLVVKKIDNTKLKELIKNNTLEKYLIKNYKKFFLGDGFYTEKDVGF